MHNKKYQNLEEERNTEMQGYADNIPVGQPVGPYYPQPRIEIRPRPRSEMDGRIYAVASSDDSVESSSDDSQQNSDVTQEIKKKKIVV